MGCDIHIYTEMKRNDGTWFCTDHFEFNPYYDPEDGDDREMWVVPIYDARNYNLFATLANVRNDYGVESMDEPRGLPDDVSSYIKEESDRWGEDGHSHSWFTAKELFIWANKHPTTLHSGMVSPEDAKNLDEFGTTPKEWCGWTSIETWEFRKWESPGSVLEPLIKAVKERMCDVFWIWDFEKDKEEKIWKRADDFRIVFWFDN